MKAFLIIEKPDHAEVSHRRSVTAWMPYQTAEELRQWLIERSGQTNEFADVTVVPQTRTR